MFKQTYNQHTINVLKQEINMLRSLVIGTVGKDKEGNYNPHFVKKILNASEEKPTYAFKDKTSFLKQLN
ncbi:MAG: hypothetical protein A3B86_00155 [Candidatus Yanofskybacteria bacterium RIFCSPHIGHO2_02_FULL_38_22b]|uniref:Uncharacterized protein n=1 Tax=Candidatus Yanofskybacteria bacterium RIFCSPHIGHO2_02_FULL_38_22b TaxID=1802673 RepID=A0A1F8F1K3_9BACT|nr:MAG: hypothetical protein A2816_01095 [Candidatus Yanofskybacteria bacterium RIFCSPHIGHO2_01_FULL_39_44]OGN07005.1 MAG: hypothetical protein A3B86_00155 [Candidatus Yanofskybacteria bacterium RIFCSPHIGHO2_02_FULL_38_22b]